ncbi:hypothetical protein SAY86_031912 [Trapa natans]|uniref:Fibronectin type-III domain-containing protein n=1 Tax=Trapa natans TaxID=22666 RepID=A0AAN7LTK6_TRANT|nr:hypothetical protein SAY86_031912 [Trapa natans]
MDSHSEGDLCDLSKCSNMSLEQKRGLVYQISQWPYGAPELLQSWSRQEILEILCLEMGKERKYTGVTKLKMIEHLLRIVSEKKLGESKETYDDSSQRPGLTMSQRKAENPPPLHVPTSGMLTVKAENAIEKTIICKNTACKASLGEADKFCKRCSCSICFKYDDNKDPSLWLICNSDLPFQGDSCGMSFHLECFLKHERSRLARDGLDGVFYCVSCGKVNDILGCWRKQLLIARDTRREDILCYRLALTKKLTSGTEKYNEINGIVEEAVKKLEAEVGPLSDMPVKLGRGIVNRLSSGPAVQKLCANAIDILDSLLSSLDSSLSPKSISQGSTVASQNMLKFEDAGSTSITVILNLEEQSPSGSSIQCMLWHREASESDYPSQATCNLSSTNRRFTVLGLVPSSQYLFKMVLLDGTRELGSFEVSSSTSSFSGDETINHNVVQRIQSPSTNCSSLSNPSSVEDETNNPVLCINQNGGDAGDYQLVSVDCLRTHRESSAEAGPFGPRATTAIMPDADALNGKNKDKTAEETGTDNGLKNEGVPSAGSSREASLPITPCKMENTNSKDVSGRGTSARLCRKDRELDNIFGLGSTLMKKRRGESGPINNDEQSSDLDFEFHVKLIRRLECKGHIEKTFRQKFLTWYTLRATPWEVRIVKAFVDTFIEDPAALAEQLIDTFSGSISSIVSSSVVPSGLCMKLWH